MPARLQGLPTMQIPLRAFNMVGLPALRALLDDGAAASLTRATAPPVVPSLPPLASLIDDIIAPGHGLVMVMGKGGVGKTTIAAAIAAELASRGHSVHLSTTDPAAHIATTLAGQLENLTTSRIDPIAETKAYVDRVMATRGANLDEAGRTLLAEDLRSPCYEEVAVFEAFSRIDRPGPVEFCGPGHCPDRAHAAPPRRHGSYHRQILATETDAKRPAARLSHVVTPLMRLRDPEYTKVLLVTLAETTPVSEAAQLQEDLGARRLRPTPGSSTAAWPPRAQGTHASNSA